jgi:glutamine synthetase
MCPRYILSRSKNLLKELGYEVKAGIEIEFTLTRESDNQPFE